MGNPSESRGNREAGNLSPGDFTQSLQRASRDVSQGVLPSVYDSKRGLTQVNDKEYPPGLFNAQVRFAQKWAEISGGSFADALIRKTALYRTITGEQLEGEMPIPSPLAESLNNIFTKTGTDGVTNVLYRLYEQQPRSNYHLDYDFGAFDYDYYPERRTVKVHFGNPTRGESPLAPDHLEERRSDFKKLLAEVHSAHPEATRLDSASWIRSTTSYQSLFPVDLDPAEDQMVLDMNFAGDSVWGQFIDRNGNTNERVYHQFVQALDTAQTTDDLLGAFPFRVLRVSDPIEKYYRFYGVENGDSTALSEGILE